MVVQAKKPVLVYGTGEGRAEITFAGQTQTVLSNDEKWSVEFPAMEYGGPYEMTFVTENETVSFENIYVGEVFMFCGQSNMAFKMKDSATPEELYIADDRLRIFSTDRVAGADRYNPKDGWVVCKDDNIKDFSAIAYLSGSELARNRNIAIGIIVAYQGCSSIESFMPKGTYERIGINLAPDQKHPGCRSYKNPYHWHFPGSIYECSMSQAFPFPVGAVVWYQGESNSKGEEAYCYLQLLTEFIRICRNDFKDPDLPVVVVQIADLDGEGEEWKVIQKAQDEVQYIMPHVKTVVSKDVCETDDLHPKTKHHLSKRIVQALESFLDNKS